MVRGTNYEWVDFVHGKIEKKMNMKEGTRGR